jgi:hypothetical protein
MRAVAGFLLSFVLTVTLGTLMFPQGKPKIKPKPLARTAPAPPNHDSFPVLPVLPHRNAAAEAEGYRTAGARGQVIDPSLPLNRHAARDPVTAFRERIQFAHLETSRGSIRSGTIPSGTAVGGAATLVMQHSQATMVRSVPPTTANGDPPATAAAGAEPATDAGSPPDVATNTSGTTSNPDANVVNSDRVNSPPSPQRNASDKESSGSGCLGANCDGRSRSTVTAAGGKTSDGLGLGGSSAGAGSGSGGKEAKDGKGTKDSKGGKDSKDGKDGKDKPR